MRLLLRANAHRRTDNGGWEIAASPDTPGRERWQWHIRLHDLDVGDLPAEAGSRLRGSDGVERLLEVSTDEVTAGAQVQVHDLASHLVLRRTASELLVILVHRGGAVLDDRHVLAELDALVLEGDDPLRVGVDATVPLAALTTVRLIPAADRPLAWVP